MKFRRTAYLLLAALVLILTGTVHWIAVRIEQIRAEVACLALHIPCTPEHTHLSPLVIAAIWIVGGLIALSFGWLAWQEHLLIRQQRRHERMLRIFDMTSILIPPGSENGATIKDKEDIFS